MRGRRVVIGSDHGGLQLKQELCGAMTRWGVEIEDVGCSTPQSVDYPDFAFMVTRAVLRGAASTVGVLVCGTGIGMSIAANKVPGIRAALCHEGYSAWMARAHNDANVLCLGGRTVGPELAREVLAAFLESSFEGGRHQQRLDKIAVVERGEATK